MKKPIAPGPRTSCVVFVLLFSACVQPAGPVAGDEIHGAVAALVDKNGWYSEPVRLNDPSQTFGGPRGDVKEAMVAVDPTNPRNIILAALDFNVANKYDATGIRLFRSSNAGLNWSDLGIVRYTGEETQDSYRSVDPVVLFDTDGIAYHLAMAYPNGNGGLHMRKSMDGGATWGPAVWAVKNRQDPGAQTCYGADKPMMGYDEARDRLVITYTRWSDRCTPDEIHALKPTIDEIDAEIYVLYSDDKGETWTEPILLRDSYAIGSIPRAGTDGILHVATFSTERNRPPAGFACPSLIGTTFKEPFGAIAIMTSGDGGRTWHTHVEGLCDGMWFGVASALAGPVPAFGTAPVLFVTPSLSVDRSDNAAYLAYLSFSFAERRASVYVISSRDGGATWSRAVEVTPGPAERSAMMPSIVANEGRVRLLYSEMIGPATFVQRTRDSTDGGKTWGEANTISPEHSTANSNELKLGHYNWLDAAGDVVGATWAGGDSNTTDLWFRGGAWSGRS